jgi:hypothetical protein
MEKTSIQKHALVRSNTKNKELDLHGEHYDWDDWEDLEDDVHRPSTKTVEDDQDYED